MKQFWKSYHVFLPQIWLKLLVYLGYPLVVLGLTGFLLSESAAVAVCFSVAGGLIVSLEILLDGLIFEGIASKDTNKLEYLKTSVRGMKILRNSIVIDAVRRVVSTGIMLGVLGLLACGEVKFSQILAVFFMILGVTELGLIVIRSVTVMMGMFVSAYLGATVCMWSIGAVLPGENVRGIAGIACVCYLLLMITGRIIIMRKARGSYYDK